METDEGYKIETLAKIREYMGILTAKLIFNHPSEIKREIEVIRNYLQGESVAEFIIDRLRFEAENILKASGDLEKLELLKDYDSVSGEEGNASLQVLSAKQVLISADKLKIYIARGEIEKALIEMICLMSAAICANAEYLAWRGIRAAIATESKKPKRELEGIQQAIAWVLKNNKARTKEGLWKYFLRNYTDNTPLEIDDYEIYVELGHSGLDENFVCQREVGTNIVKRITQRTFLGNNYYFKAKKGLK
jgi:hypothetical protein